ncbi:MAG: hypothetical protein RQ736_08825 [Thiogranum sp.]|nr:hypothetical protein [Thiogranum sp.]
MYRLSIRRLACTTLLFSVLFSSVAQSAAIDTSALALPSQTAEWLSVQHDLYLLDINGARDLSATQIQQPASAPVDSSSAANAADPAAPVPTALWILGAAMIGLSAIGRRRNPSIPATA